MNKKKGFTLAEVLISLTIIGVIAAITVPALIQRTNKQEYVSALQKAYSTLSQVTNQIIAEEGSPKCNDGGWACDRDSIFAQFKKHLNIVKECGKNTAGCFEQHSSTRTFLCLNSRTNCDSNWNVGTDGNLRKLVLADGMQILIADNYTSKTCGNSSSGSSGVCANIWVDINGVKGPNEYGRDVYMFVIKEQGLSPRGCDSDYCVGTNGFGCACKVLREGAINY